MKKFVSRLQTMRDRAAELQSMVKQAPTRIAELRETLGDTANDLRRAVDVTSDELQHLRSDVEQNLDDLRVTDDERLLDSLKQFDAAIPVFREAGYEVGGADIELSPSQRLIVHLNRFDDVPERTLQNLAASNTKHPLLHSILKALEQAEAMADRIDLNGLVYYKLLVTIGAVPEVKMCWCPDHSEPEPVTQTQQSEQASQLEETSEPSHSFKSDLLSSYAGSSIFDTSKKYELPSRRSATEPPALEEAPEETPEEASEEAAEAAPKQVKTPPPIPDKHKRWSSQSLERFKKMP